MLATILVFTLFGCKKENSVKELTLNVGDTYTFNDKEDEDIDVDWNTSSDHEDVAEARCNKYIEAYSVGNATIKVTTKAGTDVYKVKVVASDNRDGAGPDQEGKAVKEEDLADAYIKKAVYYLGCSFNAFESDGLVKPSDFIITTPIIIPEDIVAEINAGSTKVNRLTELSNRFTTISKSSVEEVAKAYQTKVGGELQLDIKGIVGVGIKGKYEDLKNNSSSVKSVFNTVAVYCQREKYWLSFSNAQLRALAMKNEDFWEMLTEPDCDPMTLFDAYGTHMVKSVVLGGRIDIDYVMESSDMSVSTDTLLDISGDINAKISAVDVKVDGSYLDEEKSKISTAKARTRSNCITYGGSGAPNALITNLTDYTNNITNWYAGLSDVANHTVIGVQKNGLMPIWDLLPKNDDNMKKRATQLKEAYNAQLKTLSEQAGVLQSAEQ